MSAARFAAEITLAWLMPWRAARRIREADETAAWLLDAIMARHRQAAPAAAPRPALRLVQGGRRTS